VTKRSIVLCCLMILAVVIATAFYAPALPERIPVHWNFQGHVDGYGARASVWLLPLTMVGILLLAVVLPKISPRDYQVDTFASTYSYLFTIVMALLAGVDVLMLHSILTGAADFRNLMPALMFVMLILMGNPMGKVRRNFFMGIRTPWTLASERVWYATHRLAGKLMVVSGILGLLAVWIGAPRWVDALFGFGWVVVVILYSLVLDKRAP